MKKFEVILSDFADYGIIEAETKEEAIEMALDWWSERMPDITAEEYDENEEEEDE